MQDDGIPSACDLDEFETFYHDFYSFEDYQNLQKKLSYVPEISREYEEFFKTASTDPRTQLTWYDEF